MTSPVSNGAPHSIRTSSPGLIDGRMLSPLKRDSMTRR
jgi:hypothetical protein